jgi:[ribosomal protein S5]-alanine N-acetyltransferase
MLVGKKIILRPLRIEDLEKTHQWRNNLELIKLVQGVRFPKTMEMDKEWFNNALNDKSNRNIYFGIDEIKTSELIGIVHLSNIDYISNNAVWGFMIGEKIHRGKGIGVEFSNLTLNYSFKQLNLNKIISYIVEDNSASLNLFNKLGFSKEGTLRKHFFIDGDYKDVVIMSLLREDYLKKTEK